MLQISYPCPECQTTNSIHDQECQFEGTAKPTIEKSYTDIISLLTTGPHTKAELARESHGEWSQLHKSALGMLRAVDRIEETDDGFRMLTADEYAEEVSEPSIEPMKTIYEHGSVSGCHDNAVFALVAWYEMVGLSWQETRENVLTWLHETGTWDRGGFEESSPEELVDQKQRVHEEGYGWKQAGQEAKSVIERQLL
jgi:hypothetical protein